MDYGRALAFGGNLNPAADFPAAVATAQAIDRAGLDFIGVQDHLYQRRFFDTWTLIASLVPLTKRAHFVIDVINLPLRPAPMLAKAAASLDVFSGGRFEDEYYSLHGYKPGPAPAHRIEIWLGALGPRMLRLTGATADGWIPSLSYVPAQKALAHNAKIDEGEGVSGPAAAWVERLTSLARDTGMDTLLFWPTGGDTIAQLERFAHEVAPRYEKRSPKRGPDSHYRVVQKCLFGNG